ncbi:hypothetical protein Cgig2_014494 [Carnegiea gigantea]|uniref:DUF4283 domain-containing protein n=1 Tax=Carnegiea gigantea TaxID=171969 RepID=A0A9Q1Q917_9CARY|nr:hypothetical protein Cgig2_014494 [Carnegiea gigantea]
MARGRRRRRPKQIQSESTPTPDQHISREESIIVAEESIIAAISTVSGNGTVTTPSPPLEEAPSQGIVGSYASLVNLDEGTSLKFVEASIINGVKCAKIATEDVTPEQSAILCPVLGANPPLEVMEGYLRRICLVKKGVFIMRFNNLDDQLTVVKRGVYYFDNKPLPVKPWNLEMDINTEAITSLPIWVRFMDLDIKYWGLASLSKLGSILGIPIKTDKYTMEKTRLSYARFLIETPVDEAFPNFINFVNDQDVVVRLQVKYEWKPIKCQHCRMYGHKEDECRKKTIIRKEWRKVPMQTEQEREIVESSNNI